MNEQTRRTFIRAVLIAGASVVGSTRLLGKDGFEQMVDKVGGIEKKFGIYELSQFTPKI